MGLTKDEPDFRVGIGTSIGVDTQLKVAGTATTSLEVVGESQFEGTTTSTGDVIVGTGVTLFVENINVTNTGNLNVGLGSVQQLKCWCWWYDSFHTSQRRVRWCWYWNHGNHSLNLTLRVTLRLKSYS